MKLFGINSEANEVTAGDDRLRRPWTVFIFGVLLSVGFVAVMLARSTGSRVVEDKGSIGLLAFAALAVVLSGCYAFIGATHSKRLAQRIVGIAGLVIIVGGLAWLLYALLVLAP
jgi:hypothetical protein